MRHYPDEMILDWMQHTGGEVNWKGIKGWRPRNGHWHGGNLREMVGRDITDARKNDRPCVSKFLRSVRGCLWKDYLCKL